jgi:adenylate cyclase
MAVCGATVWLRSLLRASRIKSYGRPSHFRPEDDNVQFTVYRPRAIVPDRWYTMVAFAHLAAKRSDAPPQQPDPIEEVKRQAVRVLGERETRSYRIVTQDAPQSVPRQETLTFVPEVPGVEFNPPLRSFCWTEEVHREEFRLRAGPDLVGQVARGRLSVFLGDILLADVALAFPVDQRAGTPEQNAPTEAEHARRYRKIFASYSHQDSHVVEQIEHLAQALGDEYLRDWKHLRAGQVWDNRLLQMIEAADVFQLFWSRHAMESQYVRREYEHALSLNRPNFVRPTYWEDPLPCDPTRKLPPETLLRLHFQRIGPLLQSVVSRPPLPPPTKTPEGTARQARPAEERSGYESSLGERGNYQSEPTRSWQIQVSENQQMVFASESDAPVELGRQADRKEAPYSLRRMKDHWRVVIAPLEEHNVSQRHALVEAGPQKCAQLTNLSTEQPIHLADGTDLPPLESRVAPLPLTMLLGNKMIRIQEEDSDERSPDEAASPPGRATASRTTEAMPADGAPAPEGMMRALEAVLNVLHGATTSSDFLSQAARAVIDLVQLDSCRVLVLENDQWTTHTVQTAPHVLAEADWAPSRQILNQILQAKKTTRQAPELAAASSRSLYGMNAVVAAPILDRRGEVIGVLYGERHREGMGIAPALTKLDAMLVQLIATGVAAGLARLEQEKASLTARVQFEQFFTAELAYHLEAQPDLLEGREAQVTILFCDIRGFSRFSERLGPAETVAWIRDVMGVLSECVLSHRGVVVDYIGDDVMAMWGAPEEQPDHAQLACRAALDMLSALPKLNRRWEPILREPIDLGIGINTGIALVGNIGSPHKFKYAPLGNSVNLASRVQGATQNLKTQLLITGATYAHLGAGFDARRLCRVRMVNIQVPVDLYELPPPGHPCWQEAKQEYETGLMEFEKHNFRQAASTLASLRAKCPDDGPAQLLLFRAMCAMAQEPAPDDLVWELPGK